MEQVTCLDAPKTNTKPTADGMCSEECEGTYIQGCLGFHCSKGDGVAICTKELADLEGPFEKVCTAGCHLTDNMKDATCELDSKGKSDKPIIDDDEAKMLPNIDAPQTCSEECAGMLTKNCIPHHCRTGRDGPRICKQQLAKFSLPFSDVCTKGCILTSDMEAAACKTREQKVHQVKDEL
jgi:hypothetical protein